MKEPESQEQFDAEFDTSAMSTDECLSHVEDLLIELRQAAGKKAGEWLAKHGYFNGHVDGHIYHHDETKRCEVVVTLTCYGLPLRIDEDQSRAVEACRRYFDHCERVSISGGGNTCDSVEMAVRQSLKREARDAVFRRGDNA